MKLTKYLNMTIQEKHDLANIFMDTHSKENYDYLPLSEWLSIYGYDLPEQVYKKGKEILELFDN